jgi:outer membrane receptor for Fe3+-dicitrate
VNSGGPYLSPEAGSYSPELYSAKSVRMSAEWRNAKAKNVSARQRTVLRLADLEHSKTPSSTVGLRRVPGVLTTMRSVSPAA